MSVRKREWVTPKGEAKSAWVVDYTDSKGKRRLKTFAKKEDADAFSATASVEVREGTHC
jgi:integrase